MENPVPALRAALSGHGPGLGFGAPVLVHLTFRSGARRIGRAWGEGGGLSGAIHAAVHAAAVDPAEVTQIEFTRAGPERPMVQADLSRAEVNRFRGLMGIAARHGSLIARIGPMEMLTRNLGPMGAIRQLAGELRQPPERLHLSAFAARQALINWPEGRLTPLTRGQPLIPQDQITRETVTRMGRAMEGWLLRNTAQSGAMTYKYWPSSGEYSASNNMIRQFMATAALARMARARPEAERLATLMRNVDFNLQSFLTIEGGLGLIHEGEKIKLGAAAVALIALLDLPDPLPRSAGIAALARFLLSMQRPDGHFRTFLRPEGRDDCQNFYPGEACLALMRLHEATRDPALPQAVRRAFDHYHPWHLADPNPAFIPWWTMALVRLHQLTGEAELSRFVFQINDWLLTIQAGPDAPADVQGEFFDPARPEFGPPHASATGVYLEGLTEAWVLAKRLGDTARAETYRRAILSGLRSLRQLQFRGPQDAFYIGRMDRVEGALRSSAANNEVRVDNVQHGLMAIQRLLSLWTVAEFRI